MNRMIAALLTGTALLASAPSFAADIPEPIPSVPPPAPPIESSAFDWTGVYIGVAGGYNWSAYSLDAQGASDTDAFMGGAFIGVNYAIDSNWIVGAEADVMFGGGENYRIGGTRVSTNTSTMSTYRARIGYAFDSFMVYGTGGFALGFGDMDIGKGSDNNTHLGYTVGAGLEAALTENITARAEYLWIDTSTETYKHGNTDLNADMGGHMVKAGLAYKF